MSSSSCHSSSSSTSGHGWPNCKCGSKAVMETSWTDDNPGRRFLGCRHFREGRKCKFFEWVDDEICKRGKAVIIALRNENIKLKLKMKQCTAMEMKTEEYVTMESKVKQYEKDLQTMELRVQKLVKDVHLELTCGVGS
ncbi:hypothetical protein Vadar_020174 [Vaccinium darrowii]|uniref:Uncharacterized protein n=1 Tax=Vaccinium darrowii TaxID=229202 RepID=A0ACB7ZLN3_9ERIC|nr:hypothetical protein Vadar_020174 [Vaccinium darrowii]